MWNKTRCHKRHAKSRRSPKHWYLPRFCLFVQHTAQGCGTGMAKLSQASMPLASMPKTLVYLQRFRLFVQHIAQGCRAGHVVTSVHANRDDAQNAGLPRFRIVVQHTAQGCGTSVHAFGDQARTPVFTAFLPLSVQHTKGLGSELTQCVSETKTQCNRKSQAAKSKKSRGFLVHFEDCFFREPCRKPTNTQLKRPYPCKESPRPPRTRCTGSYGP